MKIILLVFFALLSLVLFPEDGPMEGHHSHKMHMQGHSNTPVGLVAAAMHHHGFMLAIKQSTNES
tara:strand:+ start:344 stop:538 length:195 start_codon:yes stop_codon:yes gene_type:complete